MYQFPNQYISIPKERQERKQKKYRFRQKGPEFLHFIHYKFIAIWRKIYYNVRVKQRKEEKGKWST